MQVTIFIDSGGGCDVLKVKFIQCMVCNPGNYGRNTNICNNDDDKGTEIICQHDDKSCVKKVAKSKYRSGFSEALPF